MSMFRNDLSKIKNTTTCTPEQIQGTNWWYLFILPKNKVWRVYTNHPVCPSVHISCNCSFS